MGKVGLIPATSSERNRSSGCLCTLLAMVEVGLDVVSIGFDAVHTIKQLILIVLVLGDTTTRI